MLKWQECEKASAGELAKARHTAKRTVWSDLSAKAQVEGDGVIAEPLGFPGGAVGKCGWANAASPGEGRSIAGHRAATGS
jgi:hypothetical protein